MRYQLSEAFWALYARVYDQLWDNELADDTAAFLIDLISRDSVVLEVGAGTGVYTERLVRAGLDVHACEPERHMFERVTQKLPTVLVDFVAGHDWEPRQAGSVVVAVNVMHMAPDPLGLIADMQALAGGGGRVILVTPDPDATLRDVAAAQHRHGVSSWRVARFIGWHLVLGPLGRLTGMTAERRRLDWVDAAEELGTRHPSGSEILRLLVLPGQGAGHGSTRIADTFNDAGIRNSTTIEGNTRAQEAAL